MTRNAAIGIDYGTESCRAVVVDLASGSELGEAVHLYRSGVIDEVLPATGQALPPSWALQDPADYVEGLTAVVRGAVAASGLTADEVVGIGIDTTACTVIPTTADGVPLATTPHWRAEPHAYAKLWKHHAAQRHADRVNALARTHGGLFLNSYGGKISAEWLVPKALEIFEAAPDVFAAADRLIELEDWLVSQLVGHEVRGAHVAGYKANYRAEDAGYPSEQFLEELSPGFAAVLGKLGHDLVGPGARAGGLTEEWAQRLGLRPGTAVASGNMDAHVAMLACGVAGPGDMVLVMGTSVCNLVLSAEKQHVEGMSGVVKDGIIPGYWAYEAGQPGVGDTFGWYVRNFLPQRYAEAAEAAGVSGFDYLADRAAALRPGESGLVALDWFNGNRSVLVDAHLSGVLVGMTLATRPEHVYRALVEAAAFGQRTILEAFESSGVAVDRIVACGGLPGKSPLLMQVLADATGREIHLSASANTPALGAALHAGLAAGSAAGGYDSFAEAAAFGRISETAYTPDPEAGAVYDRLYRIYDRLSTDLGRRPEDVMYALRDIAADAARHQQFPLQEVGP
ncbi:ribulokinase [Oceanitalea stevensii]|uniref:Ribulokinase n=1 Tax=Oceanitalea stevensii TaxID=2763072 RepID=A0ABR8Z5F5_9MICO|nr:ribulokinase [Oceanitalea stevensii]MBD8063528.1 ribulokinase [Oceanitalea stevensii]